MKNSITSALGLTALVGFSLLSPAIAAVSIDYVSIGNANNLADSATGNGAVGYAYNIGKYEETNAQYAEFLKAKGGSNSTGIYNENMARYGITQNDSNGNYTYSVTSGSANLPVVYVSWFNAARFTNWMGNGQGNGDMETGAYTLNGAMSGIYTVNPGATTWIPSENEWYKAAYYNSATASYSLFPNGQNSITGGDMNFNSSGLTNVGYGVASSYGTFGQGGNAWEWNDGVIGSSRLLRGGSWGDSGYGVGHSVNVLALASSSRLDFIPENKFDDVGFRVASVPEPSCVVLTLLATGMWVTRRKR